MGAISTAEHAMGFAHSVQVSMRAGINPAPTLQVYGNGLYYKPDLVGAGFTPARDIGLSE